jgi:hypothetical protein
MRKLALAMVLFAASLPLGAKVKYKQKEFDPVVVRDVRAVAGRYVGIQRDFVVELAVSANGKLSGTLHRFGTDTPLQNITIDGAELRSNAVRATFVDRVKNGEHAFGLMVRDISLKFEGLMLTSLFCRRE